MTRHEHMPRIIRAVSISPDDVAVSYPARTIEVLAVPYDIPAPIHDAYGTYTETIARGAFKNVQHRARRVKVFRDHDPKRVIGFCAALNPHDKRGLVATMRVADGVPLGDETLALADQGVLDVSICAEPQPGTDIWSDDGATVTRTDLWLHEVSLVPLGAYGEVGAGVLAVRTGEPIEHAGTPNLDTVRAWRAEQRYSLR